MFRMSRHRSVAAVAIGIAALGSLIAGCGSDGSGTAAAPLSKAQYLKEGNRICKQRLEEKDQAVRAGLEEIPQEEFPNLSQQSLKKLGEGAAPSFQKIIDELGELPPPAKDKKTIDTILAELEAAAGKVEANPALLAKGDPFREAGVEAKSFGLDACNL